MLAQVSWHSVVVDSEMTGVIVGDCYGPASNREVNVNEEISEKDEERT